MHVTERHIAAAGWVGALLGAFLLVRHGLRSYVLTDYRVEALPAMNALMAGDLTGYLRGLPGYGGALMLESPLAYLGRHMGPDPVTGVWRSLAAPGVVLLGVLAALTATRLGRQLHGARGAFVAFATALLLAGSPVAILAEQVGHPEELLVVGLAVAAVLAAIAGRTVLAAVLVGLAAAGKPWALVAVPVVLCACPDRRRLAVTLATVAVVGAALTAPGVLVGGGAGAAAHPTASATATGIFKPASVFWFFGPANPQWDTVRHARSHLLNEPDPARARWAQRLEPAWVGRVSHPAVVLFAGLLALLFALRRRAEERRGPDLLLLLAAACWGRCLLDTWNIHYYALGTIVALAVWEARCRRPPLLAAAVTGLVIVTFRPWSDGLVAPDTQAALYLAWAVPLLGWMVGRLLAPGTVARVLAPVRAAALRLAPTLTGWLDVAPTAERPTAAP